MPLRAAAARLRISSPAPSSLVLLLHVSSNVPAFPTTDLQVPVELCSVDSGLDVPDAPVAPAPGYGDRVRSEVPLRDFSAQWRAAGVEPPLCYLKDWHLARQHPLAAAGLYRPPPALGFDGLNAWCDTHARDDFRFVYVGPARSWTPLHHDVLFSASWSANVAGRKRWILFPPSATPLLSDASGRLVPDARPGAWPAHTAEVAARLQRAWGSRVEAVQGAGDVIVVPPGWHHQVRPRLLN